MTTPNQSVPDVTKSVGLGAYVVDDGGGSQKYGQSGIDGDFVRSFFFGNMAGINILDLPAAISKVVDYLSSMSLDVLAILKPLIPGAAIDAWDTVENAVTTIVDALRLDQVLMTFNLFQEWLTSIFGPLVTTVTAVVSDAAAALAKIAAFVAHAGEAAIEDVGDLIANIWSIIQALIAGVSGSSSITDVISTINAATTNIVSLITGVGGSAISDVVTAIGNGVTALTRIGSLISGVSGTVIADVYNAINAATSKFSSLISGVSGTTITDVINAITAATTKLAALISGVSGTAIADVVTAINNGVTALTRIASLISGVTGGSTITDVVTAINAATTKFASLISGVSGTTITDVVTAIGNGVTALARIASLISGISGTTITDVVTVINAATSKLASLISGVSGTTITDVVTAINAATTKIASLISGVSGTVIADVVTAINNGVTALTRISSLISGVSGATVIADVVTAINNATSKLSSLISGISGTTITDVVNAINAATSKLTALISGVGGTVIADVVTVLSNVQLTLNAIYNAVHNTATTGHTVSDVLAAIGSIFTGFFNALTGQSVTSAGQSDVNTAVTGAAANIAGNSALLNAAQTTLAPLPYGSISVLNATVDFGTYANNASAITGFTIIQPSAGHGTLGIINGQAAWTPAGTTGTWQAFAQYNVASTVTDNQIVSAVVPGYLNSSGIISIYGRYKDANNYVVAQLGVGVVQVYPSVSGSAFIIQSSIPHVFQPGATYSLVCGTAAGSRFYDVQCNGVTILGGPVNDSGAHSQVGATFRGGALGMTAPASGGVQVAPATVSRFSLADNVSLLIAPSQPGATVNTAAAVGTSSTTYAALSNSPSVTVTVGSSGMVALGFQSEMDYSSGTNVQSWTSFAATGTNTIAAADTASTHAHFQSSVAFFGSGFFRVLTGLATGITTFQLKARVNTGTVNYGPWSISAIPL